jgi:U3 small nucleolar RNA-associated protein 12
MKLYLSLYGHNLPVLAFDMSSDDTILVSGSADKNLKVWGMDYGNIQKSIFAHDDSITAIKFVKDTHYFFSGSKDGTFKYYDADTVNLFFYCFLVSRTYDF